MELSGSIRTTGPAEDVVRGLTQAETLTTIAPTGFEFRKVEGGVADFLIRRNFGPIALTLQGTMSVAEAGAGKHRMEIKAAHLLGGRVAVLLDVTSGPDAEGHEALTWAGELNAQGLAGRLLTERSSEANSILRNLFLRLRDHVEAV